MNANELSGFSMGLVSGAGLYLLITALVFLPVIKGLVAWKVTKNRGMPGGFWWGFFLGVIGIVVQAVRPKD